MNTQKEPDIFSEAKSTNKSFLILHNDDVNSFDFVIDTLIDICEHNEIQAEQCASITHHNGKCDIKKGEIQILENMRELLLEKGLSVTIDN